MSNVWAYIVTEETGYFKNYLKLIKDSVRKEVEEIEARNEQMKADKVQSYTDEEGYFWDPYESLADDMYRVEEMEQLMLRTFVIGVFVFLEHQINYVCSRMQSKKAEIFSYKDIQGNGVTRSIKYLKKLSGIEFPKESGVAGEFEVARIIRNSLVHSGGLINKEDIPKLELYIEKNSELISINQHRKVLLSCEYAEALIVLSTKISTELHDVLPPEWPFERI